MSDKTSSGEPTFGIPKHQTAKVRSKSGTNYVGHHDGETWYEGHYADTTASGNPEGHAPVQLAEAPHTLVTD